MRGEVTLKVGNYKVDAFSWFEVRLCDGGVTLTLCDRKTNMRFLAVIDEGKATFGELTTMGSSKRSDQDPESAP
jgi:hypothetical protein